MVFVFPGPLTTARTSTGFVRAIFGLVTTSAGWMLIGVGLFLGGLIWGLNSHQISYVVGDQGAYTISSAENNFYVFRQQMTGNIYVIQDANFRPGPAGAFDGSATYTVPGDLRFIASTNTVFVAWGVGLAHPIEKVTVDGTTYVSAEYQTYPHGYTINNWPYASPLMLAGLLCLSLAVGFLTRAKKQQKLAAAAKLAKLDALPSPFARELSEQR